MRLLIAAAMLLGAATASADTVGKVQSNPGSACVGFKPHQLCFETPKDGVARAEYRSEPFYAVILITGPRCNIADTERQQAQALFPKNKVFATRFDCDDEETITYTNVNDQVAFLAVYAGATPEDAARILHDAEATNRFPGANVRKMQAVLVYP
jgi:hypothetical protein